MARPSDEFRRRLDSWKDAREIGDELEAEITGKFQALPPKSTGPNKLKLFDPARINTVPAAIAFVALVAAVVVLALFGPEWARAVFAP